MRLAPQRSANAAADGAPEIGPIHVSRSRRLVLSVISLAFFVVATTCYLLEAAPRYLAPLNGAAGVGGSFFVRDVLVDTGASLLLLALIAVSTGALLTSLLLCRPPTGSAWPVVSHGTLLGAAALISALVLCSGTESIGTDAILISALVLTGSLLTQQASRSIVRLACLVLLLSIGTAAGAAGLFRLATSSPQTASAESLTMTSGDADRIAAIRDAIRRASADDRPVELTLTSRDLELVADRCIARAGLPIDCDLWVSDGEIDCLLFAKPWGSAKRPLRVEFTLRLALAAGQNQPDLEVTSIRLGTLTLPRIVGMELSRVLSRRAPQNPAVRNALAMLDEVSVGADSVRIRGDLDASLVTEISGAEDSAERLLHSVRECAAYLLERSDDLPRGDARLEEILRLAFEWAQAAETSGSAVSRNRVALMTLAAMVGSNDIAQLIQHHSGDRLPQFDYAFTKFVTARDRRDRAQHLVATAGLAAWTSQSASETVGLLKEEWDAARGGSGFSFADFQADCAGARLGFLATRDEPTARRLQQQISGGVSISEILPDVHGLPENISAERLRDEFGGFDGDEFRLWEAEIERRLRTASLLDESAR